MCFFRVGDDGSEFYSQLVCVTMKTDEMRSSTKTLIYLDKNINTSRVLILKVIDNITVKCFSITILSALPLFPPPFAQKVLAFCFDKILYLFYTKYPISFSSVSTDTVPLTAG